jgi:hypothetical protein
VKAKPILSLILVLSALFYLDGSRSSLHVLADTPVYPPTPAAKETQGAGYDALHQPVHVERVSPSASLASDGFGYSWNDSLGINWVNASDGTPVSYDNPDDGYSNLIDIGFNFKFYEHSYSQVSISVNGLLTFESGTDALTNQYIPQDILPNNLVAPFWDDLKLGNGKIFHKLVGSAPNRAFVVEWYQVSHFEGSDILTFEAILYENGNMLFQYLDLNGELDSATVGIEDKDGVNGLLYLYNAPGLSSGKAVQFIRPPASPRVKTYPLYQSGFAVNGQASFNLTVQNIGETGPDTYNLTAASSNPGWSLTFRAQGCVALLLDNNQDGKVDTGSIAQAVSTEVCVDIRPSTSAKVGDFSVISLTATSTAAPGKSMTTKIQVAIPAPFAQAYADSQAGAGMYLEQVWKNGTSLSKVSSFFTGNTLSLASHPKGNYIYAWEKNGNKVVDNHTVNFSNIEYVMLSPHGRLIQPITAITDNGSIATSQLVVNARYPALAVAPDGQIGILWAQYKLDLSNLKSNSNVFFAILNSTGQVILSPINLTNNNAWHSPGDYDIPLFSSPRIAASGQNRFVLSWIDNRQQPAGDVSGIYNTVYTSNGTVVKSPTLFVQSSPQNTLFVDLALTEFGNNRAMVSYSIFDLNQLTYSVAYADIDDSGNTIKTPSVIPGSSGWRVDAAVLSNGNIILAWKNPATDRITISLFDNTGANLIRSPYDLPLVGVRSPDYVSIAPDLEGHAILTWMDVEWNDYLYYSVVDSDGSILTPPMIFATGQASNPLIQTSFTGLGNAPYDGSWQFYLPLLSSR